MRKRIDVHLGISQRDRVIADWIDSVADDPDTNVSEIIKRYLYKVATGQVDREGKAIYEIRTAINEIRNMIKEGGIVVAASSDAAPAADLDEIERRLGSIAD